MKEIVVNEFSERSRLWRVLITCILAAAMLITPLTPFIQTADAATDNFYQWWINVSREAATADHYCGIYNDKNGDLMTNNYTIIEPGEYFNFAPVFNTYSPSSDSSGIQLLIYDYSEPEFDSSYLVDSHPERTTLTKVKTETCDIPFDYNECYGKSAVVTRSGSTEFSYTSRYKNETGLPILVQKPSNGNDSSFTEIIRNVAATGNDSSGTQNFEFVIINHAKPKMYFLEPSYSLNMDSYELDGELISRSDVRAEAEWDENAEEPASITVSAKDQEYSFTAPILKKAVFKEWNTEGSMLSASSSNTIAKATGGNSIYSDRQTTYTFNFQKYINSKGLSAIKKINYIYPCFRSGYTLSLFGQDGKILDSAEVYLEDEAENLADTRDISEYIAERDGYNFIGWCTDPSDIEGTLITDTDAYYWRWSHTKKHADLYAVWEPIAANSTEASDNTTAETENSDNEVDAIVDDNNAEADVYDNETDEKAELAVYDKKTLGPFYVEMDSGYDESYYDKESNTIIIKGVGSTGGVFKVRKDENTTLSDSIVNSCSFKVDMDKRSSIANIDLKDLNLKGSAVSHSSFTVSKGNVYLKTENVQYNSGFYISGDNSLTIDAVEQTFYDLMITGDTIKDDPYYKKYGNLTLKGNIKILFSSGSMQQGALIDVANVSLNCENLVICRTNGYDYVDSYSDDDEAMTGIIRASNSITVNSGNIIISKTDESKKDYADVQRLITTPKITVNGGNLYCYKGKKISQLIKADEMIINGGVVLPFCNTATTDKNYIGKVTLNGGIFLDGTTLRIAGGSLPDKLYTDDILKLNNKSLYSGDHPQTLESVSIEPGSGWIIPEGKRIICTLPVTNNGKIINQGSFSGDTSSGIVKFDNIGSIVNEGEFTLNNFTFLSKASGSIINRGNLNVTRAFINTGTISNEKGRITFAKGLTLRSGTFTNAGDAVLDIRGGAGIEDGASLINEGILNTSYDIYISPTANGNALRNKGSLSLEIDNEDCPPSISNYNYVKADSGSKLYITTARDVSTGEYTLINLSDNAENYSNLEFTLTGISGQDDKTIKVGGASVKYGNASYKPEMSGNSIILKVVGGATARIKSDDLVYTGKEIRPAMTVRSDDGKLLTEGKDYEVSYKNNINAGKATATVKMKGSYAGEIVVPFTIEAEDISIAKVNVKGGDLSYNGSPQEPAFSVYGLKANDYDVRYEDNTDTGTAKLILTGKGNYCGTAIGKFNIVAVDISNMELTLSKHSFMYSGTDCEPEPTIDGIVAGTDYIVTYEDNVNIGTGKITVKGIGNYTGSITKEFSIICGHKYKKINKGNGCYYKRCTQCGKKISYTSPCYIKSFKLARGSRSITVKWKKMSSKTRRKFTGYRIRYSRSSDMSNAKTVYVSKNSSSKKIGNLSRKKRYYVEIRSYVKKSGCKYYSKIFRKSIVTK